LDEDLPEGRLIAPAALMADGVSFTKIFRLDDDVGHGCLDQIGEGLFRSPETGDAQVEEDGDDGQTEEKTGEIEGAVPAEEAPAEPVDNSDHGIEAVEEAPLLRDDITAESDGGDVEAELDDKGDDVAEIPVFDVESGDPESRAEAGQEGKEDEKGEVEELPAGKKLIPDHHPQEDDEADEKIDKGGDKGGGGDDQPGEIDLADEVGVVDQAV